MYMYTTYIFLDYFIRNADIGNRVVRTSGGWISLNYNIVHEDLYRTYLRFFSDRSKTFCLNIIGAFFFKDFL